MWNELIPVFVHVKHSQDQEWFFPLERERPKPHFPLHMRPRQKWQPADAFSETFGGDALKTERFPSSPCISCNLSGGIYTQEIMTHIPTHLSHLPLLPPSLPRWKEEGISRRHSFRFRAQQQQQYSRQQVLSSLFSHHQGR